MWTYSSLYCTKIFNLQACMTSSDRIGLDNGDVVGIYSGRTSFESRLGHWVSWIKLLEFSFRCPKRMLKKYLEIAQGYFQ
jgi:hypothetical protein